MRIGKVIGNVVSVAKHEKLKGIKLLVIKPVDAYGNEKGRPLIVADYLNSGVGDLVYWIEDGTTICKWKGIRSIPLRGCIVGIIDSIDLARARRELENVR
ncbi:MAG: EutN/CcmL family microcompartment protein [Actinobacteria bacterium]|nr:EutN/CcmL family microcompartment protein [Actinomycetota bacterium]